MKEHPEVENENLLEPTIGEQLRYEDFKRGVEKLDSVSELKELVLLLAKQAMVLQPASIRYLAREAARNLTTASDQDWTKVASDIRDHLMGDMSSE
tara:strand:+ start:10005 stop:10292 length:288 start_codon:yes stop_codon:yes gene_type:complete